MVKIIGIIKNVELQKNIILQRRDYKTIIFDENKINKNSNRSYLKFDKVLNLYKTLPNLNSNIESKKLNIIISKNINESLKLLFNSQNTGIIDKLFYNLNKFPCMFTYYIYNTKINKFSKLLQDKKEYKKYLQNNLNIIKGHLFLEIITTKQTFNFLLLNLKYKNKSFYNMIYYLNIKKNKNENQVVKYDSLIIRTIDIKLLKNNINVYFLLDNNIENKNNINNVLKYYFKLINTEKNIKPFSKKISKTVVKNNIIKKVKSPKYNKNIVISKFKNYDIKSFINNYLDLEVISNNVESDNDSTILDNNDLESDDNSITSINNSVIGDNLFKDYDYSIIKKSNPIIKENNKYSDINYLILDKKLKYIDNKINYISNIINNKNKENFNMINQLLYKRIILNKLELKNNLSKNKFLDIVKKTQEALKIYIESLNSILI